jgi:diaminopimelate epimerase
LDESVNVQTRGGVLSIAWAGLSQGLAAPVLMTGPAATVFESEIELP